MGKILPEQTPEHNAEHFLWHMILINSAVKQNLFWKNLQIQSVRTMT